jgi:uncharacterized protein YggE
MRVHAAVPFLAPAVPTVLVLLAPFAAAQAPGLRGNTAEAPQVVRLPPPDPASAERVITIEGVANVRVPPTSLRVVLAASTAAATAPAASRATRELVARTSARLEGAGIAASAIDTDFIALVPVFTWAVEEQAGREVVAERRTGTRVQYNLHVTVRDEAAARAAVEAATAEDGVELLAVDYWSDQLAGKQAEAMQQALAVAQQKAKVLLAHFPVPPRAINVHESTKVLFPQQLYQPLAAAEDSAGSFWVERLPRVPASRPLRLYYRGLFADVDAGESAMPGRRDLEIVSTVRLYYAAPERPPLVK